MQFTNSYTETTMLIKALFATLTLIILSIPTTSFASSVTISCTGLDGDNEICSIETDGGPNSQALINLVGDIIYSLNNNTQQDSTCSRAGSMIACDLEDSDLLLSCNVEAGELATNGTCRLATKVNGETVGLDASFLSINCEANETNGECVVGNRPSEVAALLSEELSDSLNGNDLELLTNIVTGCGVQSGTAAFQRDCNNLISVLGAEGIEQIQALIDVVAPRNIDAAVDTNILTAQYVAGSIRQRLARVRGGSKGIDTTALRYYDGHQWVTAGTHLASSDATMLDTNSTNDGSLYESEKLGVFIDGSFADTTLDGDENGSDANTKSQTLTFGFDYRFNASWIAGVAFSFSSSSTEFGSSRGDIDTQNYSLIGYGSYYQDAWYIDATFGVSGDRYDQTRDISCSAADCGVAIDNQSISADYYGDQTAFTIGMGYDFTYRQWAFTPFAQYSVTDITVDAYNEDASNPDSAGAGYALSIDEQNRDSVTWSIGTDARYTVSQDWGVLVPYLGLEFVTEQEDDAQFISGKFLGNVSTGEKFELATGEIDSSYYLISAGASATFTGGSAIFIDIKTLQGYDDSEQIRFTGGYRAAF